MRDALSDVFVPAVGVVVLAKVGAAAIPLRERRSDIGSCSMCKHYANEVMFRRYPLLFGRLTDCEHREGFQHDSDHLCGTVSKSDYQEDRRWRMSSLQ